MGALLTEGFLVTDFGTALLTEGLGNVDTAVVLLSSVETDFCRISLLLVFTCILFSGTEHFCTFSFEGLTVEEHVAWGGIPSLTIGLK